MALFEASLPATPAASRSARTFLRASLATQELDGVGEVIELLTSELVANAVVHARSAAVLRLIADGSCLRVEVDDTSDELPVLTRASAAKECSGRGLWLVDDLASRWGFDLRADGKTVWFEIDLRDGQD